MRAVCKYFFLLAAQAVYVHCMSMQTEMYRATRTIPEKESGHTLTELIISVAKERDMKKLQVHARVYLTGFS